MTVAADILENAKELTKRYADSITTQDLTPQQPKQAVDPPTTIEHIPARVFVLLQSNVVLGVISREDKALEEAQSLMAAYGCEWRPLVADRIWTNGIGVYIEISAHDVR